MRVREQALDASEVLAGLAQLGGDRAVQLFERADLEALFGRPSSTKPMSTPRGNATILAYDALRAAFLVNDKNEVILLVLA